MTHPDDLLAGYVDGDLDERALVEVDTHLATCERCRADVRSARLARDRLASEPAVETPSGFTQDVLDAVGRESVDEDEAPVVEVFGRSPAPRRSSKPAAWLGAVAAAAAIVIGAFVFKGVTDQSGAGVANSEATAPRVSAPTDTGQGATGVVLQPGHDYDEAGIERLAAAAAAGRVPVPQTTLAGSDEAAAAAQCLAKGAQLRGDEHPIELIQATFDGKPADLGIYRLPGSNGGPERIAVWVVSSRDCSVLSFTQHLLQG
jgi:anti-sigma factor RsiW